MMKQVYEDLWQTTAEYPFRDRTSTHAYLLTRADGNVLFYGTRGRVDELEQSERLGGITRQYLSHHHEAGTGLPVIKKRFGSRLCCHRLDASVVDAVCPVDLQLDARETHLGSIEIIPTPGHTPGSTCFLVSSPNGRRYLFTGDSIFPEGPAWGTYVSRGQRRTLGESLLLLRDLAPDVVMSSACASDVCVNEMSVGQWASIIDEVTESLR
jgi:glyoxylase-like metal-dependent hydrolase (beta-lactamase superfamily II)